MYGHKYSKSMDQPGKVTNPARGQLTGKINISLSAFAPENLVSRDKFGIPVPPQSAHLRTQAKSGAYIQDSSRVPLGRPFIYSKPPYDIGSGLSLSGHAILPWQVTIDQLICASLSHTHDWYDLDMLKVRSMRVA